MPRGRGSPAGIARAADGDAEELSVEEDDDDDEDTEVDKEEENRGMSAEESAAASSRPSPATLPAYLARWAVVHGRAIAIRHKSFGVWATWTWTELQTEVRRVAGALEARGFGLGDVVAIASGPSPEALAVVLAAQGLGGAAVWIEPDDVPEGIDGPSGAGREVVWPAVPASRFALARDEVALARLRARLGLSGPWTLGLFTADHGSAQEGPASAVRAYVDAVADVDKPTKTLAGKAQPSDTAFYVSGLVPPLTHAALIGAAQVWLEANEVRAEHGAFTWEAPTSKAAATFIAGWLVGGISLILPEDATTADADRREAQPTIVAATGAAYGRLRQQVADNLPAPGTLLRRVVDAGLASAAAEGVRRAFGAWLVRRPLRKVLGFRRAELALVLGAAPPPAAAQDLFARLDVPLLALCVDSGAEAAVLMAPFSLPDADRSTRFQPALALSPSAVSGKLT